MPLPLATVFADRPDPRMETAAGKSARRSAKDAFTGCWHVVSAWAVETRLILGARCVPGGGHEIATIPDLLAALDAAGAVVTIDAAGCRTEIVRQIRDRGGDDVVTVKGNLHRSLRAHQTWGRSHTRLDAAGSQREQ